MINDYLRLSYTFLRNRGLRSWLTIVGIFIGIAAVVTLISLGEGLRLAINSQFDFLSTDILTIQAAGVQAGPPGTGVSNPLKESYVSDIEHIPGVETAIGRSIQSAELQFNGRSDFTFAASMPDGDKRKEVERIGQIEIYQGRDLKDNDMNKVVLGYNFGQGERVGRTIAPKDKVLVQGKEFTVVGLLKKKGSFIIDNAILMNEDEAKKLFDINNTYSIIVAKVAKGNNIATVKERVENYMRRERKVKKGTEDFTVQSADQAIKDLDATLFAVQIFIYVIAGISIVVGGIGIANTMYTSVIERTRYIGVMKSVGAKRSNIFTLFLIESGLLGMVGGIAGVSIGTGLAYTITFIGRSVLNSDLLRIEVSWYLIFGALLFSFVIGSIAGILPALQASKLRPVEALTYTK